MFCIYPPKLASRHSLTESPPRPHRTSLSSSSLRPSLYFSYTTATLTAKLTFSGLAHTHVKAISCNLKESRKGFFPAWGVSSFCVRKNIHVIREGGKAEMVSVIDTLAPISCRIGSSRDQLGVKGMSKKGMREGRKTGKKSLE